MNLQSWINNVATAGFTKMIFGQSRRADLSYHRPMMFNTARVSKFIVLAGALLVGPASAVFAQTNYYAASGTEYSIVGSLPGPLSQPIELSGNKGSARADFHRSQRECSPALPAKLNQA